MCETDNDWPSKDEIELYKSYREEIRFEFMQLATRMNWYITCQSFLLVAFAILTTSKDVFPNFPWFSLLVAGLGGATSIMVVVPIAGAHKTIEDWVKRQRRLFTTRPGGREFDERESPENNRWALYALNRDKFVDVKRDSLHETSLLFSRIVPTIFLAAWVALSLFAVDYFKGGHVPTTGRLYTSIPGRVIEFFWVAPLFSLAYAWVRSKWGRRSYRS